MIRKTATLLAALVAATLLSATPAHAAGQSLEAVAAAPPVASGQLMLVSTIYTVAPGDTLSGIAARFCGHPSAYPALAAASRIANPDRIYPGQRITLHCTSFPKPAAAAPSPAKAKAAPAPARNVSSVTGIQAVIDYAMAQIGKPYVWGAVGPNSYDCSGLVVASFKRIGISLPHYTGDLLGRGVSVSRANLRPGDLVFPSYGHVMIYIGDGRVVEAPHAGANVRIGTIYAFYAGRRITS